MQNCVSVDVGAWTPQVVSRSARGTVETLLMS